VKFLFRCRCSPRLPRRRRGKSCWRGRPRWPSEGGVSNKRRGLYRRGHGHADIRSARYWSFGRRFGCNWRTIARGADYGAAIAAKLRQVATLGFATHLLLLGRAANGKRASCSRDEARRRDGGDQDRLCRPNNSHSTPHNTGQHTDYCDHSIPSARANALAPGASQAKMAHLGSRYQPCAMGTNED